MENPFKDFNVGELYTNKDIKQIITTQKLSPDNPMAFTYNRWNKGMSKIQPYFEYIDRNSYKYVGSNDNVTYSGEIVHVPQDSNFQYLIGNWNQGQDHPTFLNPKIKDFKQWKDSLEPEQQIVSIDNKLTLSINGKINYYIIKKTNEEGFDGKYKIISHTSKLGKLLLGKKIDDSFSFGKTIINVIEII